MCSWRKPNSWRNFWWKRIWEKTVGMRLALWLDKRHPEWCWAELYIQLGMGWDLRNWREQAEEIETCRRDCARNGSCWCGKLMTAELRERFNKENHQVSR